MQKKNILMKNKIPKFLKANKLRKVKKHIDNPSVELSARKKIDRAKQKRKEPKTLSKIGFEYKDRKDYWK
tara:strand:- start:1936 stop:2145 length:210 start_codon:yes stop_codon:yes gene_type:complete